MCGLNVSIIKSMVCEPKRSADSRWVGVGHSTDRDSRRAGAEATGSALLSHDAKLVVVFCSAAHDLEELLASINLRSGGVPLVGCSTAGEISPSGPGDGGVVVVAFGGDGFSVATAACRAGCPERLREAAAGVAACAHQIDPRRHRVLLLLTDGLTGDMQEVVRGAYNVAGPRVPLVGGCAGDDLRMDRTYQLHGTEVLAGGVVAAALSSDAPFGIGVRHGWRMVGEPLVVTHSDHARVYTLDDAPALDVYLERSGAPVEAHSDPAAFTAFALTHPLAVSAGNRERQMRALGRADFEERSLVAFANVPQGGLVWISEGDERSVLDAVDGACCDALEGLGGHSPRGVIAFDCIARREVLGHDLTGKEAERIAARASGSAVAGFYTYGEIARSRGANGFHNQTLVVLAIG